MCNYMFLNISSWKIKICKSSNLLVCYITFVTFFIAIIFHCFRVYILFKMKRKTETKIQSKDQPFIVLFMYSHCFRVYILFKRKRKTETKIQSKYQLFVVVFIIILFSYSYLAKFRNQILKIQNCSCRWKIHRL